MSHRGFAIAIAGALATLIAAAWFQRADLTASSQRRTNSKKPFSGESLFLLRSSWTTDGGRAIRLPDLGDSANVLALVFTQCSGSCPILVKELQMLERNMPSDVLQDTHFLLVTIDPQSDTIAALRAYRQRMKLDSEHWILLRGESADVRELAAVLGFNYVPTEAQQFAHSNVVTVLNRRGEIVHQQTGAGGDPGALLAALRESRSDQDIH